MEIKNEKVQITKGYKDNLRLNSLPQYAHAVCKNCGRSYPETVLNIWDWVHHRILPSCLNKKECQQIAHKKKVAKIRKNIKYIKPINQ